MLTGMRVVTSRRKASSSDAVATTRRGEFGSLELAAALVSSRHRSVSKRTSDVRPGLLGVRHVALPLSPRHLLSHCLCLHDDGHVCEVSAAGGGSDSPAAFGGKVDCT